MPETLVSHHFTQDVQLNKQTNKQTKLKLFCKFIESFDNGSVRIRNGDFQIFMTGVHK